MGRILGYDMKRLVSFDLTTLFLAILAVALSISWWLDHRRLSEALETRRQSEIERIREVGGTWQDRVVRLKEAVSQAKEDDTP